MTKLLLKNDKAASIVTGAGSGIGAATAIELAKRGSNVALVGRRKDALIQVAKKVEEFGVRASVHPLDITNVPDLQKLAVEVEEYHGGVHILVNNAGVALFGSFRQLTLEEFRWLLDINLWGAIAMTKVMLPLLEKQSAAHIANISSVYGLAAPAGRAPYATSKFALRGFTESIRHELQNGPISVGLILPGGIKTEIAMNARVAATVDPAKAAKAAKAQTEKFKMTAYDAAKIIVDSIEKRQGRVLIGSDSKALDLLVRILPTHYWSILKHLLSGATDTGG